MTRTRRLTTAAPATAPGGARAVAGPRPEVLATIVGSYPTPEWLRVRPTRDSLRDATLVVVRTQGLAGIDVVSDGELSRFDVNHPETNGMIDFFVGPLDGAQFARLSHFLRQPAWEATNNGAERAGRAFRHGQGPHFNLRSAPSIDDLLKARACDHKERATAAPARPHGRRTRGRHVRPPRRSVVAA
jgi:hypothetical protein